MASDLARATAPASRGTEEAAAAARCDVLRAAVAALPPWERVVLTLRDVEGLGPDEAAAVLGVTEQAQYLLLHRARTAVLRREQAVAAADERRAATG
jgi:RNA polymerase sigma-70 factor (ECF subfamily)